MRMTIIPNESTYPLPIPTNYIGKTLEIVLYASSNVSEKIVLNKKKPSDFFGTLDTAEGEKFQDYVSNSRLEWNRNI